MSETIYGIHAIGEALKRGERRFDCVSIAKERNDPRIQRLIEDCRAKKIAVRFVEREEIDRVTQVTTHQGVMATTSQKSFTGLEELIDHPRGEHNFLLVLDGIEDPHNLGALIRTADGAGVDGVIIPERRAAGITGTVVKSSAGATEYINVARVVNIARTVEELKEHNIWTIGLDERGEQSYEEIDYGTMNCAIVMGAEGRGLHDLVARKCDMLVSIPMMGEVSSLNVSVAGGVVMYEVLRQRRALQKASEPPAAKPGKKRNKK
jgi:23S rRNA (guanosine2251-2'-O)-methyltransferase